MLEYKRFYRSSDNLYKMLFHSEIITFNPSISTLRIPIWQAKIRYLNFQVSRLWQFRKRPDAVRT